MEPGTHGDELIVAMEQMLLATFPPLETEINDGVMASSALGVTGRANSAVVVDSVTDVTSTVAWATGWLQARDRSPLFRLSPMAPVEIADMLGNDNAYNTTSCMYRQFSGGEAWDQSDHVVAISEERPADWISEGDAAREAEVSALMDNVDGTLGWALIRVEGHPLAAGRAVVVDDWVCIQAMYTEPAARGQGLASTVLGALHEWAVERGARNAFLNVLATNVVAKSIYGRHGYEHVYDYTYYRVPFES